MPIRFDKCKEKDVYALQQISVRTFLDTYTPMNTAENMQKHISDVFNIEQLLLEINNPDIVYFFMYVDNQLAGYIKINTGTSQSEAFSDEFIELERIYLIKCFQGKGYGRELIEKALEIGRGLNANKMWLGVWKKNTEAVAFYEKIGFKIFDEHIFTVGEEEQMDWMMEISLIKNS